MATCSKLLFLLLLLLLLLLLSPSPSAHEQEETIRQVSERILERRPPFLQEAPPAETQEAGHTPRDVNPGACAPMTPPANRRMRKPWANEAGTHDGKAARVHHRRANSLPQFIFTSSGDSSPVEGKGGLVGGGDGGGQRKGGSSNVLAAQEGAESAHRYMCQH